MVAAIFVLQCLQAGYQVVRDVRYVRYAVAGVRWLILWVLCVLYRFCRAFFCRCTACKPGRFCCSCKAPEPFQERVWVYTPSLAWETDRNAANRGFQLNKLENLTETLGQQPRPNLALEAYKDGNVTYYVDVENAQRLRFYLGVRKPIATVDSSGEKLRGVFMWNIRRLFGDVYIGSHKSSGSDYYEECMSGYAFRAVKCCLVVDPDPPAPMFSLILAVVSAGAAIARPKGTKAVIILGVVLGLDVLRSLFLRACLMKLLTCVEFWFKSMISKYCKCPCTTFFILLLESIFDERMKNPSQYTNSYARLNDVALLGNGSRVACKHEVVTDYARATEELGEPKNRQNKKKRKWVKKEKCLQQSHRLASTSAPLRTRASTELYRAQREIEKVQLEGGINLVANQISTRASTSAPSDSAFNNAQSEIQVEDRDGGINVVANQRSTEASLSEPVVISFDRATIKILRPLGQSKINLEWHTGVKKSITEESKPEICMASQDDYDYNDWGILRARMEFAAKYRLFPVWSMDEQQAHCKDIKYDFFNGRYLKGCVIRFLGNPTRVVGGDFDLPKEAVPQSSELEPLLNTGHVPSGAPELEVDPCKARVPGATPSRATTPEAATPEADPSECKPKYT